MALSPKKNHPKRRKLAGRWPKVSEKCSKKNVISSSCILVVITFGDERRKLRRRIFREIHRRRINLSPRGQRRQRIHYRLQLPPQEGDEIQLHLLNRLADGGGDELIEEGEGGREQDVRPQRDQHMDTEWAISSPIRGRGRFCSSISRRREVPDRPLDPHEEVLRRRDVHRQPGALQRHREAPQARLRRVQPCLRLRREEQQ